MRLVLRFRIFIIISLAVLLISAAVVFSVLRAVLPYATGYKIEIQQEISQQIGLPVEIESIDAAIHWFSPRLKLIGVSVYDERNKVPLFNFKEAFVELDVLASIIHNDIIVDNIGLVGADLSIERLAENEWLVQGIKFTSDGSSELPEQFFYMLLNADYLLHDSNIYFQDHTGEKLNLSLLDINMDVRNSFGNHRIKFSMNLPEEYGRSLAIVADLQGELDSLDGEVYIEAQQVNVEQWIKKFKFVQQYQLDTVLDVNLWGTIEDNDIQSLVAQVVSRYLSITNKKNSKRWDTPYLTTNFRYLKQDEGWNLAVSNFYFGTEANARWQQPVTILASDDGEYYNLSADFLRLTDLQQMADVALTPELKSKFDVPDVINKYDLKADIYNLNLQVAKEVDAENIYEQVTVEGTINDFSMHDTVNEFKLTGLDASIQYGDDVANVELQTSDAVVELNKLLRYPVQADILQGRLRLERSDDGWLIDSRKLQLKNAHINSFSRFKVKLSADENIFIDAQTNFYDAYGKHATQYLPVGIMKPNLINWLDMAVTDGYVPSGSFILFGDLGSFPYDRHDGVFQVLFSARDINMKFMKEWPSLKQASGTIKFKNQSLFVTDAKAKSQGVELFDGYAEFLDLKKPHLTVRTNARGKNEQMQSYVWNSPLDDILGNTLRLFQFEGSNDLNLTIDVPLDKKNVDVAIDGHLNFIDTQIYYPALGYELSAINGVVDFTKESVFADSIVATINKRPVSINAYTEDGAAGQQVVFHLDGIIEPDYLLQRYTWIPEDWVSGHAEWSMDFEVPYKPDDYLVHVSASSKLQNMVIDMSDKVHFENPGNMFFTTDINILGGGDLQVSARLSEKEDIDSDENYIIDLFAVRDEKNTWSFNVKSDYMTGKGEVTEGLGKDTKIKLDLEEVDVHSLFVTKNGKGSNPLNPSDFPPLDWKARIVHWDDWTFTDVELVSDWHIHGMLINTFSLKGPAMTFDARGTWLTSWNAAHETVFQGEISSSNCGVSLVGLGYQRSLDRCSYQATFDSKWPAEPYAISWAIMKGNTSFEMNDGEILEVEPGTGGRLLGLLNIFKLANRLAFDFDDVTRQGFSFDNIKGELEFSNGNGSLKNFDVSAPAADINMFGRIGMVERDYGLLMRVKPHTDTLTFAGGTLLGGVVVGAGLALIQKVFDLGVIGHNVYSITGTWDEPIIEQIVERSQDTTDDDDL
ncbi:MAG: hypothetical protein KJN89_09405 [Gammaproteobacteria bacterium]|nr:hypothetical protein [Gammaproteobacteria bacterium]NNJ50580.1 hypothetical protein [Gammaproteobacteria bacterium]